MTHTSNAATLTAEAWNAVAGDDASDFGAIEVEGRWGHMASRLPVEETAVACVATALRAALQFGAARGGDASAGHVDVGAVAAAFRSERHFLVAGEHAGMGFAPLSRLWRTRDGWLRTHANYPWHRAALLAALGLADGREIDDIAAAIRERAGADLEDAIFGAGGVAAVARSAGEWRAHPQGRAVSAEPLIGSERVGSGTRRTPDRGEMPASGVRVLDLTRVIAGPVCTRYLGALGADVLRLDPPDHPDMPLGLPGDTLLAKRSALLDLRRSDAMSGLHQLLEHADVLVSGYRPGALDVFGLNAGDVAERFPGLVIVQLAAWGHTGPWAGRRGFDSIVQVASGIGQIESDPEDDDAKPGVLPCQLLDHGTGYLAAAAALDGLRRQRTDGGTYVRRVSLARTAEWLVSHVNDTHAAHDVQLDDHDAAWITEMTSGAGGVHAVRPPGRIGAAALRWPDEAGGYGAATPSFRAAAT